MASGQESRAEGEEALKAKTLSSLKTKLDKLWSEYIRRKDAIGGIAKCVTCGAHKPWKELQCGHFVSRVHLATRFLEQNCAPQCYSCNVLRSGNYVEYAVWMEANWGWQTIRDLRDLKHKSVKYTRSDYEQMIKDVLVKLVVLRTQGESCEPRSTTSQDSAETFAEAA